MENQVQNLKLNVTNIKNSLFKSNKELKKLKVQKRDLFFRIEKKREFREEEKRIETPNLGVRSSFSKINSAVTSPIRSVFGRILDFFGLIALGIVANNLPQIIQKINDFFNSDFIKNVGSILETIGTAFESLGNFIGSFSQDKQKEYEGNLKEIDKTLSDGIKNFDNSDSETTELEDLIKTLGGDIENLNKELDKKSGNDEEKSKNQWWDFLNVVPNKQSNLKTPQPKPEPPSGTGGPTGGTIPKPEPKPQQKLSSGGTIKGDPKTDPIKNKPIHQPKQTPQLKVAKRSANEGFTGFSLAVNNISQSIEKDSENVKAFAELAEKIRILNVANSGISTTGRGQSRPPGGDPLAPSPSPTPVSPTPGAGGPVIQFYGGQGRDRSGEPGVDFSFADYMNNYAIFDGVVTETGKLYGAGYGNVVVVRSTDPSNGKKFDALYAHFPDNGISVAEGQTVSAGTLLGRVGWDESRGVPMPGAGNMTGPHTSVDFYEPNTGRGQVSGRYSNTGHIQNLIINGANKNVKDLTPNKKSNITPAQVHKLPPGVSLSNPDPGSSSAGQLLNSLKGSSNGGKRTLTSSKSGLNNSVSIVYAVQTVVQYVPFGYPVPMAQESTPQVSEPPQLPSIWRA